MRAASWRCQLRFEAVEGSQSHAKNCAHATWHNPMVNPGTRLGSYEIGPVIGIGGMGEVYRARETKRWHQHTARRLVGGGPAVGSAAPPAARFSDGALQRLSRRPPRRVRFGFGLRLSEALSAAKHLPGSSPVREGRVVSDWRRGSFSATVEMRRVGDVGMTLKIRF